MKKVWVVFYDKDKHFFEKCSSRHNAIDMMIDGFFDGFDDVWAQRISIKQYYRRVRKEDC